MATDAQKIIIDLLEANWNTANTNSIEPEYHKAYEVDRVTNKSGGYSAIVSYEISHPVRESALGGYDREDPTISLEIITDGNGQADGRQHALKLRDEAIRIIRLNARNGVSPYIYFQIIRMQDLSNDLTGVQKHVVDVRLTSQFNFYG